MNRTQTFMHSLRGLTSPATRLGTIALLVVIASVAASMAMAVPLIHTWMLKPAPAVKPLTDAMIKERQGRFVSQLASAAQRVDARSPFFPIKAPPPPLPEQGPTYNGPAVVAMMDDYVWFQDGKMLEVGGEAQDGLSVLSVQPPWQVTVRMFGKQYEVPLSGFERKSWANLNQSQEIMKTFAGGMGSIDANPVTGFGPSGGHGRQRGGQGLTGGQGGRGGRGGGRTDTGRGGPGGVASAAPATPSGASSGAQLTQAGGAQPGGGAQVTKAGGSSGGNSAGGNNGGEGEGPIEVPAGAIMVTKSVDGDGNVIVTTVPAGPPGGEGGSGNGEAGSGGAPPAAIPPQPVNGGGGGASSGSGNGAGNGSGPSNNGGQSRGAPSAATPTKAG